MPRSVKHGGKKQHRYRYMRNANNAQSKSMKRKRSAKIAWQTKAIFSDRLTTSPEVLSAWHEKKTLRQNLESMGLVYDVNTAVGKSKDKSKPKNVEMMEVDVTEIPSISSVASQQKNRQTSQKSKPVKEKPTNVDSSSAITKTKAAKQKTPPAASAASAATAMQSNDVESMDVDEPMVNTSNAKQKNKSMDVDEPMVNTSKAKQKNKSEDKTSLPPREKSTGSTKEMEQEKTGQSKKMTKESNESSMTATPSVKDNKEKKMMNDHDMDQLPHDRSKRQDDDDKKKKKATDESSVQKMTANGTVNSAMEHDTIDAKRPLEKKKSKAKESEPNIAVQADEPIEKNQDKAMDGVHSGKRHSSGNNNETEMVERSKKEGQTKTKKVVEKPREKKSSGNKEKQPSSGNEREHSSPSPTKTMDVNENLTQKRTLINTNSFEPIEIVSTRDNTHRPVVEALEKAAQAEAARQKRERMYRLLPRDVDFCSSMIENYGDDYAAMTRDSKNIYQETEAQIARKIRIFRESPHFETYQASKSTSPVQ